MYHYIIIASDTEFSKHQPVKQITGVLKACPECVTENRHWFKNLHDLPWFRVNIRRCDSNGNYPARLPQDGDIANMVEIIGLDKGDDDTHQIYVSLASKIAMALNWVVLPDDEVK